MSRHRNANWMSSGGFGRRRHQRRGRVQVVGCGPGCLMTSLLLSVALTILVNVLIRMF